MKLSKASLTTDTAGVPYSNTEWIVSKIAIFSFGFLISFTWHLYSDSASTLLEWCRSLRIVAFAWDINLTFPLTILIGYLWFWFIRQVATSFVLYCIGVQNVSMVEIEKIFKFLLSDWYLWVIENKLCISHKFVIKPSLMGKYLKIFHLLRHFSLSYIYHVLFLHRTWKIFAYYQRLGYQRKLISIVYQ